MSASLVLLTLRMERAGGISDEAVGRMEIRVGWGGWLRDRKGRRKRDGRGEKEVKRYKQRRVKLTMLPQSLLDIAHS